MNYKDKILILPCGGSEFEKINPAFLDRVDNTPKLFKSIENIDIQKIQKVYIILFENKYIENQCEVLNHWIGDRTDLYKYIVIKPTESVVETVYELTKTLDDCELYIKDYDDTFELKNDDLNPNSVYYYSLNNGGITDVEKKSYLRIDPINTVLNIVEKDVISSNFCVGLYSFNSSNLFNKTFEKLRKNKLKNLFISHVIYDMILNGERFTAVSVKNYIDWGSDDLWQNYVKTKTNNTKKLWIYGCSHSTWYQPEWSKIEVDGEKAVWSTQLANLLQKKYNCDIEVRDRALASHSIHGIWKIFQADFQNNKISSNDIVIFNASYPLRFKLDFLINNKNQNRLDLTRQYLPLLGKESRPENKIHDDIKELSVDDNVLFTEWVLLQETIFYILDNIGCDWYQWQLEDLELLQIWFDKKPMPLVGWSVLDIDDFPTYKVLEKNIINPPKKFDSWKKWIDSNRWCEPNKEDDHISVNGHRKFAEYLYKKITND